MNHYYRLVWNKIRHQWVAVAEHLRSHCKSAGGRNATLLAALVATLNSTSVLAGVASLPQGGQVVAGNAQIGSPAGNLLQIRQTSDHAVINWNSFDIGIQSSVQFIQPSASSAVLNRVLALEPTRIAGELSANGQVYVVNPNGIVFSKGARVDAGAFVASTLDLADTAFMAGKRDFTRGDASGAIVNEGSLNALSGGHVALLSANVTNKGNIHAPQGRAILAAADAVQLPLTSSGLVTLALSPASVNAAIANGTDGVIRAENGQVYVAAAASSGLAARAINEGQIAAHEGVVSMSAIQADRLGETRQHGLVDVSSASGTGGQIELLGDRVGLFGGSEIDARGATGGGIVKIGGDVQGLGPTHQAQAVYMSENATIDASATKIGKGGKVTLWSQEYTGLYGRINARGGNEEGDGGFVETSSRGNLQAFGHVDAASVRGAAGEWLLDPTDVNIVAGAINSNETNSGGVWTPTTNSAQIGVANINADLNAGTGVTINTASAATGTGDITIATGAAISKTAGGNAALILNAAGSISVQSAITSTAGSLATTLNAAGGAVSGNSAINTNGGLLSIHAATGSGILSGLISGTGGLTKTGAGTTVLSSASNNYSGATTVNGGALSTRAGATLLSPMTINSGATLIMAGANLFSHPAANTLTFNEGSTLIRTNTGIDSLSGNVTINGAVTFDLQSTTANSYLYIGSSAYGLRGTGILNVINTGGETTGVVLRGSGHNFTGTVNVNAGVLHLTALGAGPFTNALSSTALNLLGNSVLNIGGNATLSAISSSVRALTGNSNTSVTLGAATLTIGSNNGTGATFAGTISGTGSLVKTGIGTQTLTGNNTYTGTTTISGGTLQVGNGTTTGTLGSGAVSNNASLIFNRSDAYTINNVIDGTGTLSASSNDNLTIGGAINLGGNVILSAGADDATAPTMVANGSVTGGDAILNAAVNASGAGKTVTIYSGNATTAAYATRVLGSAASLNKAYATAAGNGTVDTNKKLNVFYRVSPTAAVSLNASSKVYDATTAASINTATSSATGIDGDSVTVSGASASFADRHVGNNKPVEFTEITGSATNGGQPVSGYAFPSTAMGTGSIAPAALTLTAASDSKTYDGTHGSGAEPDVSGLRGSDSLSYLTQSFTDQNAGTGKTLAVNGWTINDGNGGANYAVSLVDNATGTILPASLTVRPNDYAKFVTKADAPAYAGLGYTGFVNGETAAVLGGSPSIARRNPSAQGAGVYNNELCASGLSSNNYTINYQPGNYTIVPANELLVKLGNSNNTYGSIANYSIQSAEYMLADGTVITLAPTINNGLVSVSDNAGGGIDFPVALVNPTYSSSGNLRAGNHQLTYGAVTGNSSNFSKNLVVTGAHTVNPLTVGMAATGAISKVYDGNATMNGLTLALNGILAGDIVTAQGKGGFNNKHAGTGKSYTVSNLALNGADGANYALSGSATAYTGNNGTITPAALTLTATPNSKIYDATLASSATPTISGLQDGDTISGLTERFTDQHVATNKTLAVGNSYIINDGNNGKNYTVSLVNNTNGVITPATLKLTASSNSKTYDGTAAAAMPSVSGLLGNDSVSNLQARYDDKNVGTGKDIFVSQYAVNDGNNGRNYIVQLFTNHDGTVTPAHLTLTATPYSKIYDGSTEAVTAATASGLKSGDTISDMRASFSDKNVGTDKTLTVTGYVLHDGNNGGNYIVSLVGNGHGTITPAQLTLATVSETRIYDATVKGTAAPTITGLQAGDTVGNLVQTYSDPNVGINKALALGSGYTIVDGNGGNNYVVHVVNSATGTITPATLTLTGPAASKTYDGSTTTSALPTVNGLVGNDSVSGLQGRYSDKNTGTGKTTVVTGYVVHDGNDGKNYLIKLVEGHSSTITPAALTLTALPDSKTYDGTTASGALPMVNGLLTGDTISGLHESYNDKHVGVDKALVVTGYVVDDGNDGKNYVVSLVSNSNGSIASRPITVAAPDGVIKIYDGTTTVPPDFSAAIVSGGIGEGVLSSTISYATPYPGDGKTVHVTDVHIDDGNGGKNYAVTVRPSKSGIILANVSAASEIRRYLPAETIDVSLVTEVCPDGCTIQLSNLREQLPGICSITSVAGTGMAGLPAGISFNPDSGQLSFSAQIQFPPTITAHSLDCNGTPRDILIHLSAAKQGERLRDVAIGGTD